MTTTQSSPQAAAQTSPKLASGSAVSLFKFNAADIRVVTLEGAPWFVAKDVCESLHVYIRADGRVNTNAALAKLDRNEAQVVDKAKAISIGLTAYGRGIALISESGLYGLVGASRKPEAQDFKRWVRQTVLPSIRKDGGYVLGEEKVASGELSEDEFIFKAMSMLKVKAERLALERDEAQLREQQALAGKALAEKQRDNNRAAAEELKAAPWKRQKVCPDALQAPAPAPELPGRASPRHHKPLDRTADY